MSLIDIAKDIGVVVSAVLGAGTLTMAIVRPARKKFLQCIRNITDVDSINAEIKELKEHLNNKDDQISLLMEELRKEIGSLREENKDIREENARQTEALDRLTTDLDNTKFSNKASLGNEIKHIYYCYKDKKQLPVHEVEALHLLHEAYKRDDGNSFVDGLFSEMINEWEVID